MSGQRKRTVFVRRLCLHGRRVACGRRAVNLRKYPSRVNFSNQRQFRVSSFKFRDARGEPLAEGCRPCRDSGFIKRAFPALKGWAKLFRPTRWDWNPRLSPETGANLGHRAYGPAREPMTLVTDVVWNRVPYCPRRTPGHFAVTLGSRNAKVRHQGIKP